MKSLRDFWPLEIVDAEICWIPTKRRRNNSPASKKFETGVACRWGCSLIFKTHVDRNWGNSGYDYVCDTTEPTLHWSKDCLSAGKCWRLFGCFCLENQVAHSQLKTIEHLEKFEKTSEIHWGLPKPCFPWVNNLDSFNMKGTGSTFIFPFYSV